MLDKTLSVKKSRVQNAARQCPDARRVLKELFPEAFEEDKLQDVTIGCSYVPVSRIGGGYSLQIRYLGRVIGKFDPSGIFIENLNYKIVLSSDGTSFKILERR